MKKKQRTERKARRPAFRVERYRSMLVQVCGCRSLLHELIEEVDHNDPKWPGLSAELGKAKAAIESVEKKLARAAETDYPGVELPRICINRG